ncbi:DUF3800 domain-containing protein [Candidatus Spongiihabitans sp.]|uniref:DUF3800 domain-containing protein n=1 Tax=Candidatus Spongiihabitans sp. TaxID=3101308 RepID=UPI003C7BB3E9
MYLCYIDESGQPDISGNSRHFVLSGLAIPVWHWNSCDAEIRKIKQRHNLENQEIHTAWILRKYLEQSKISNFDSLTPNERRSVVSRHRREHLLRLQKSNPNKSYRQVKKNYDKTNAYIHLTLAQRRQFINDVAECIANWGFARLFAECIDKIYYDPDRAHHSIDKQAFEQVVSRFDRYLKSTESTDSRQRNYGLLVHDNNETIAKKHTQLVRQFHRRGTLWTDDTRIIETPLFVDSALTEMVQIADLCSYALRRYLDNQESELFAKIFLRADRTKYAVVGIRHFTDKDCKCNICQKHG